MVHGLMVAASRLDARISRSWARETDDPAVLGAGLASDVEHAQVVDVPRPAEQRRNAN